jgi:hypothetical protein
MVAACIKAETGVGPSIASGNQVCKPNCADLPIAPKNKKKEIKLILFIEKPKKLKNSSINKGINGKITEYSKDLKVLNIAKIAIAIPKSPILLTIIALIADLFACIRVNQKLINK